MVVSPSTGCCANVQTTEESGDCHPHESWVDWLNISQNNSILYIYTHVYAYINACMPAMVWYGVVWCGIAWCGVAWYGVVWYTYIYLYI